jgi:hypothetical protein
MSTNSSESDRWFAPLLLLFWRIAASGLLPARWFAPRVPDPVSLAAKTGKLKIEIVSHCWNYSHFLTYQLSSLVLYPPSRTTVTMTVFYSDEDIQTCKLLDYFSGISVEGVTWNWRCLPKEELFRRTIGSNQAALATRADWIWFTDCDALFRQDCLDSLSDRLQGRRDILVFPTCERVTALLKPSDPLLQSGRESLHQLRDIEDGQFTEETVSRAVGPMQITHGDVARACGYCRSLGFYLRPASRWSKAHEDRAFRWVLGSQGVGVDLPGFYRIRHAIKGRYADDALSSGLRTRLHRLSDVVKAPFNRRKS